MSDGKTLKIWFIKPSNPIDVQWFPPIGHAYMRAWLIRELGEKCLMRRAANLDDIAEKPDILCISCTTQDYSTSITTAGQARLRWPDSIILVGGHHITNLPETLHECFDAGVVGEGEEILAEISRVMLAGEKPRWEDIKGIVYRDSEGKIKSTERRPPIEPLDRIPHPVWDEGDKRYVFTSRGCPFKCSFCSSNHFWGKTRFFSAGYVLEEILRNIRECPEERAIFIWDDLFAADRKRFKEIKKLLIEKDIPGTHQLSFAIRADQVTDEFCNDLHELNVTGVGFGAESGSDRILKLMRKGTTVAVNQNALDLLFAHKIGASCSFVIGYPSETEDEAFETYRFIVKNTASKRLSGYASVNILMPVPGSAVWEESIASGLLSLDKTEWDRFAIFAAHRDSNVSSFNDWIDLRQRNRSIYLNESTVPEKKLYEIMRAGQECVNAIVSLSTGAPMKWLNADGTFVDRIMKPLAEASSEDTRHTLLRSWLALRPDSINVRGLNGVDSNGLQDLLTASEKLTQKISDAVSGRCKRIELPRILAETARIFAKHPNVDQVVPVLDLISSAIGELSNTNIELGDAVRPLFGIRRSISLISPESWPGDAEIFLK